MKICILSMQKINNYGSVLQAYSLKRIIESLGHEVAFIDIVPGDDEFLNEECYRIARENSIGNKYASYNFFMRLKARIIGFSSFKKYESFRKEYLNISGENNHKRYDVCVIGSDEVFNCLQESKWGFSKQLFGSVMNAKTIITYAASCGATKTTMLTDPLRKEIEKGLSNIKSFSVRDKNTYSFVSELTNKTPIIHLDPVVIGDFDNEISNCTHRNFSNGRYCIIYSYENRITDVNEINAIKSFCKRHDLEPISFFGKQDWIKKTVSLEPFELLKAFSNAGFVITDTFHGTVFGARFSRKLAVFIRRSNKNKLEDLVERLGIQEHVIEDMDDIEKLWNVDLNRNQIDNLVKLERNKSIEYLRTNL